MEAGTLNGSLTRNLAPLFDDQKGGHISRNWLCFVGRGGGTTVHSNQVNDVKYEVIRGKRQMGTLVKRSDVVDRLLGRNHKDVGLGEYTQVGRAFPISVEAYSIQASKLTEKLPGEPSENSGFTRQQRAFYYAAKGQTVLMAKQGNLANLLVSQGILTGSQDAILGTTNTDEKYDFYRKDTHSKTLGVPWTDHANATPLSDLDTAVDVTIQDSGKRPTFALMGDNAIDNMLRTAEIKDFFDNRGFSAFHAMGETNPCPSEYGFLLKNGWECRGKVTTLKGRTLWIFDSEELQANYAGGDDIRCMPSGKVVLGNVNSRLDAQFGPKETFDETAQDIADYSEWFGMRPGVAPSGEPKLTDGMFLRPEMFYLDAIRNEFKTSYLMRSQFAPLYIPVATDEWYVIENAA